jgi:hypothetical protein
LIFLQKWREIETAFKKYAEVLFQLQYFSIPIHMPLVTIGLARALKFNIEGVNTFLRI